MTISCKTLDFKNSNWATSYIQHWWWRWHNTWLTHVTSHGVMDEERVRKARWPGDSISFRSYGVDIAGLVGVLKIWGGLDRRRQRRWEYIRVSKYALHKPEMLESWCIVNYSTLMNKESILISTSTAAVEKSTIVLSPMCESVTVVTIIRIGSIISTAVHTSQLRGAFAGGTPMKKVKPR